MILKYAYFQGLMRNNQKITENEQGNIIHFC